MDRRNAIKALSALSVSALIPIWGIGFGNTKQLTHYVGLGVAGSEIVDLLYKRGAKGKYTFITQDKHRKQRHIKGVSGKISFIAKPDLPNMGKEINFIPFNTAKHSNIDNEFAIPDNIKSLFNNDNKVVLIAGLGHYSGTNLILAISKLLNDIKIDFSTVCSIPFRFEGKKLTTVAKEALSVLTKTTTCKYYHLDDVRFKYGGDISVVDALSKGNDEMASLSVDG